MTSRDYIFTFSYETWADAVARGMMRPPDRLAATLIASSQVRRLIVANPFRWRPASWARRAVDSAAFTDDPTRRLVHPTRWRREDPSDVAAIEAEYRAYGRELQHAAEKMGMESPSLVTVNPLVAAFSGLHETGPVTYYGRDDWSSSPARSRYWPAYREAYARIARQGTAVAAVSQEIIDRIAPGGPHAVVPNGVEISEWSGPRPDAPSWFAALPGPRAVYVGTLDARLDVDGLIALAHARPGLCIVLIGPMVDPEVTAALRPISNIVLRDRVDRSEVVAVLRNSELSLVAHRRTPLTEAMSPLKLYEYLAAGLPVLSIDLAPVRGIDPRVLLLPSVSDFAGAVDEALALGPADEEARERFLTENSWAARHATILGLESETSSTPSASVREELP